MLIEFRVANHRSIRDEQVFSMETGRASDPDAAHVRQVRGHKKPVVTVAAFYGANASGKSNLLSALAFMRNAVVDSHRFWDPAGGVPRDPFAWGKHRAEPSLFEATFVREGTRYQYGFVVDDERVLEEWLFAWPGSRKQVWFEREQVFKFGEHLKGENRLAEQVTRDNALFVSTAAQFGHGQLQDVYSWFSEIELEEVLERSQARLIFLPMAGMGKTSDLITQFSAISSQQLSLSEDISENARTNDWLKRMLVIADVGIQDFRVQTGPNSAPRLEFLHKSDAPDAWMPMHEESSGTLGLLRIALSAFHALSQGSLLIVDELGHSMHPLLVLHVLELFENSKTNPKGAQLVFTTHDTNLLGTSLGKPPLARDQIWLTEKDQVGASSIYPLSDYKPRKAENVERGYLQGRYGAIPFLGNLVSPIEP